MPILLAGTNSGTYSGPYATYRDALGLTLSTDCRERNDSPSGAAEVFGGTIREYARSWYGSFYFDGPTHSHDYNDWRNVPLPLSDVQMTTLIAQIALHECCHTMGIVPASSADGGHNVCTCGGHYMDNGGKKTPLMRLDFDLWRTQRWMPENRHCPASAFASQSGQDSSATASPVLKNGIAAGRGMTDRSCTSTTTGVSLRRRTPDIS